MPIFELCRRAAGIPATDNTWIAETAVLIGRVRPQIRGQRVVGRVGCARQ